MKNKLSIIVPIYNVEQYLHKCVDSLLAQDYEGYEIILVDDGSTDSCPSICDEYGQMYDVSMYYDVCKKCIRVIHQENRGLSAARNSGIEVAQGEYLMFVDSDDYIEPNVLGGLMAQVEREQLDVLRYDYQNVRVVDGGYEVFQPYKQLHQADRTKELVDGETYLNTRMRYECYAWQWIVRRALLIDNRCIDDGCLFTEGIHFEDVDWLPRMMLKAKRVGSTQTIVYNYFWREGSITLTQGNMDKMRKNIDDRMGIIEKYSALIAEFPQCQWLRNMQSSMACGILTQVAMHFYAEQSMYLKHLREWKVFPLTIANQGKTYVRRARIINVFGPRIYCAIMRLRG